MSARPQADFVELVDPARWADEHGDFLLRFALMRVGQNVRAARVETTAGKRNMRRRRHLCQERVGSVAPRTWLLRECLEKHWFSIDEARY